MGVGFGGGGGECGLNARASLLLRRDWLGGRREHEAFAYEREAGRGQFSLQKMILRAGEEVCVGGADGGDQVVNGDGLAVEGSLHVGVGGELHGLDAAGLLRDDGPEVAIVGCGAEGEQRLERAGIEVGKEDGGGVGVETGGGAAAVCGDVEQKLRGVGTGGDGDGLVVDGGAELLVGKVVGLVETLSFGEGVVQALHGDFDKGSGVESSGALGELEAGGADGMAVLANGEAAGLRGNGVGKNEDKK